MNKPKVSIVITSWQIARLTRLCLYTVALQNFPKDSYEIIFVDDGSKDENIVQEVPGYFKVGGIPDLFATENMWWNLENKGWTMKSAVKDVKSKFPDLNLRYFYREKKELNWENPGYIWNAAIKKASGDILVQISSDNILLTDDTLHKLVQPHYETDNLYVIPRLISLNRAILDSVDKEGMSFSTITKHYNEAKKYPYGQHKDEKFSWCDNSALEELPYVYSIYKKHILEIGGYDEGFLGRAPIDVAFQERFKRIGLKFEKIERECAHIPHAWDEGIPHRALRTKEEFLEEERKSNEILNDSIKNKTANEGKEWGILEIKEEIL